MSRARAASRHLVVEGMRLHYLDAGRGRPLLLLHGTAIDSAQLSFGPSLAALAANRRVIALDWPGYGRSEYPPEVPTMAEYLELFKAFVGALELPAFDLLGFSMGGAIALGAALELPERVQRLILVASYGLGERMQVPLLPYLALRTPRLATSALFGLRLSRRLTGLVLRRLVFADPRAVTPALVDEVYRQLRRPLVERAFMSWLRGELGPLRYSTSYRRELHRVRQPVLLLHGQRDLVVRPRQAKAAAPHFPNARLELIPRCGHWVMRERPTAFLRAVETFLAEQAPRRMDAGEDAGGDRSHPV